VWRRTRLLSVHTDLKNLQYRHDLSARVRYSDLVACAALQFFWSSRSLVLVSARWVHLTPSTTETAASVSIPTFSAPTPTPPVCRGSSSIARSITGTRPPANGTRVPGATDTASPQLGDAALSGTRLSWVLKPPCKRIRAIAGRANGGSAEGYSLPSTIPSWPINPMARYRQCMAGWPRGLSLTPLLPHGIHARLLPHPLWVAWGRQQSTAPGTTC